MLCSPMSDLRHILSSTVRQAHAAKFIALSGACTHEQRTFLQTQGASESARRWYDVEFCGFFTSAVLLVLMGV